MIEETRRLAQLQKFRELRNAGVDFIVERKQRRKRREFDYGDEVPLLVEPEDVVGGLPASAAGPASLANIALAQLEGDRRNEEELRRREDDRRKLARLKQHNPLPRLLREGADNPFLFFRREELRLLPPQLSEEELLARRPLPGGSAPTDLLLPPPEPLTAARTLPQRDLLSLLDEQSVDLRSLEMQSVLFGAGRRQPAQPVVPPEQVQDSPLPEPEGEWRLDLPSLQRELRMALSALGPVPLPAFLRPSGGDALAQFLARNLREDAGEEPAGEVLARVRAGEAFEPLPALDSSLTPLLPQLQEQILRRSRLRAEQELGLPSPLSDLRAFVDASLAESAGELREDGLVQALNAQG